MNLKRAWQLCAANRSPQLVILLAILLLASIGWNVWHYQFEQEQRVLAKEVERARKAAAALAKEEAARADLDRRARYARSDARIQQLYDEINHLSRVSERVLLPNPVLRSVSSGTVREEKTAGNP
jgi:hypothetical protein